MTGFFVSFEGPEGAGKTTQIDRLAETLKAEGVDVLVTREPGGTSAGEDLRDVLLRHDWSPVAELLLMNAARDAHLRDVILPALDAGRTVLCDRFLHSSRAYQGAGGGAPPQLVRDVEAIVCTRRPDLVLLFDLEPEEGLRRARDRGRLDRFEAKGADYHARVRAAFAAMADAPECVMIDAAQPLGEVSAAVRAAFDAHRTAADTRP